MQQGAPFEAPPQRRRNTAEPDAIATTDGRENADLRIQATSPPPATGASSAAPVSQTGGSKSTQPSLGNAANTDRRNAAVGGAGGGAAGTTESGDKLRVSLVLSDSAATAPFPDATTDNGSHQRSDSAGDPQRRSSLTLSQSGSLVDHDGASSAGHNERRKSGIALNSIRRAMDEFCFPYVGRRTVSWRQIGPVEWGLVVLIFLSLVNCAFVDTSDLKGTSTQSMIVRWFDVFFTACFMAEWALRRILRRRQWSVTAVADVFLLVANVVLHLLFFLDVTDVKLSLLPFRAARMLRPLFLQTKHPNVRFFVVAVAKALMRAKDVVILYLFFLLWFGVAGVYQFGGKLRTRCVNEFWFHQENSSEIRSFIAAAELNVNDFVCGSQFLQHHTLYNGSVVEYSADGVYNNALLVGAGHSLSCSQAQTCFDGALDGGFLTGFSCPYNFRCMDVENPYFNFISFDHIAEALMSLFIALTFQLWYDMMFWIADAGDGGAYFFFSLLILIGSFMIFNVTIVMLTVEFDKARKAARSKLRAQLLGMSAAAAVTKTLAGRLQDIRRRNGPKSLERDDVDDVGDAKKDKKKSRRSRRRSRDRRRSQANDGANQTDSGRPEDTSGSGGGGGGGVRHHHSHRGRHHHHHRSKKHGKDGHADQDVNFAQWDAPEWQQRERQENRDARRRRRAQNHGGLHGAHDDDDEEMSTRSEYSTSGSSWSGSYDSSDTDGSWVMSSESDANDGGRICNAEDDDPAAGVLALLNNSEEREKGRAAQLSQQRRRSRSGSLVIPPNAGSSSNPKSSTEEKTNDKRQHHRHHHGSHYHGRGRSGSGRHKHGDQHHPGDHAGETAEGGGTAAATVQDTPASPSCLESVHHAVLAVRSFFRLRIVKTRLFVGLGALVIVANFVILAYDHYGMTEETRDIFDSMNLGFTIFFTVEAVVRFIGEHPIRYWTKFFNVLDVVVVIVSWIDVAKVIDFPVIRAMRVLRLLKLLKHFPSLYDWLRLIFAAIKASPILLVVLFLVQVSFACVGMQLFGGRFCGLATESSYIHLSRNPNSAAFFDRLLGQATTAPAAVAAAVSSANVSSSSTSTDSGSSSLQAQSNGGCVDVPLANFDDFGSALLTTFQIMTADDWEFIMYDAMRARGSAFALLFIIFFYIINYYLLNLVVAVLLSANPEEAEADAAATTGEGGEKLSLEDRIRKLEEQEEAEEQRAKAEAKRAALANDDEELSDDPDDVSVVSSDGDDDDDDTTLHNGTSGANGAGGGAGTGQKKKKKKKKPRTNVVRLRDGRVREKSAGEKTFEALLRAWAWSRGAARAIAPHTATQIGMALVIIAGSVCQALENPIAAPDTSFAVLLFRIDLGITVVYLLEVLLNVRAYGLLTKPTSYLRRDLWNVLDCALVVISVIGIIVADLRGNNLVRMVKVLRAMRPLRLIKRSPGMRLVLSSLVKSVPQMINVIVLGAIVFFVFAIAGVQFFGGALRSCYIGSVHHNHLSEAECVVAQGEWRNDMVVNFDNFLSAHVALFVIATLEAWAGLMRRAMASDGIGLAPVDNSNRVASLYFVAFAMFVGLFLLNFFVSVLIDAYNREKRRGAVRRTLLLSREQEAWLATNARIARSLPLDDTNIDFESDDLWDVLRRENIKLRKLLRRVVRSRKFQQMTSLVILLNFVAMAVYWYPVPSTITTWDKPLNIIFTCLFLLEAAIKIYAEGWLMYFATAWNRSDFTIAVASLFSVVIDAIHFQNFDSASLALIRSVRIVRLLRVFNRYFAVDRMLRMVGKAFLSLGPVLAFISLVFFIYAVVGINVFGRVRQDAFGSTTGIDRHTNFGNLGGAMVTLFRITLGGNWGDVMGSCAQKAPFCDENIGECGVAAPVPQLYFVIFLFFAMFMLRNLFIAVMLDSFSSSADQRAISKHDAEQFYAIWQQFDKDGEHRVAPFDVLPLVRKLPHCVLKLTERPVVAPLTKPGSPKSPKPSNGNGFTSPTANFVVPPPAAVPISGGGAGGGSGGADTGSPRGSPRGSFVGAAFSQGRVLTNAERWAPPPQEASYFGNNGDSYGAMESKCACEVRFLLLLQIENVHDDTVPLWDVVDALCSIAYQCPMPDGGSFLEVITQDKTFVGIRAAGKLRNLASTTMDNTSMLADRFARRTSRVASTLKKTVKTGASTLLGVDMTGRSVSEATKAETEEDEHEALQRRLQEEAERQEQLRLEELYRDQALLIFVKALINKRKEALRLRLKAQERRAELHFDSIGLMEAKRAVQMTLGQYHQGHGGGSGVSPPRTPALRPAIAGGDQGAMTGNINGGGEANGSEQRGWAMRNSATADDDDEEMTEFGTLSRTKSMNAARFLAPLATLTSALNTQKQQKEQDQQRRRELEEAHREQQQSNVFSPVTFMPMDPFSDLHNLSSSRNHPGQGQPQQHMMQQRQHGGLQLGSPLSSSASQLGRQNGGSVGGFGGGRSVLSSQSMLASGRGSGVDEEDNDAAIDSLLRGSNHTPLPQGHRGSTVRGQSGFGGLDAGVSSVRPVAPDDLVHGQQGRSVHATNANTGAARRTWKPDASSAQVGRGRVNPFAHLQAPFSLLAFPTTPARLGMMGLAPSHASSISSHTAPSTIAGQSSSATLPLASTTVRHETQLFLSAVFPRVVSAIVAGFDALDKAERKKLRSSLAHHHQSGADADRANAAVSAMERQLSETSLLSSLSGQSAQQRRPHHEHLNNGRPLQDGTGGAGGGQLSMAPIVVNSAIPSMRSLAALRKALVCVDAKTVKRFVESMGNTPQLRAIVVEAKTALFSLGRDIAPSAAHQRINTRKEESILDPADQSIASARVGDTRSRDGSSSAPPPARRPKGTLTGVPAKLSEALVAVKTASSALAQALTTQRKALSGQGPILSDSSLQATTPFGDLNHQANFRVGSGLSLGSGAMSAFPANPGQRQQESHRSMPTVELFTLQVEALRRSASTATSSTDISRVAALAALLGNACALAVEEHVAVLRVSDACRAQVHLRRRHRIPNDISNDIDGYGIEFGEASTSDASLALPLAVVPKPSDRVSLQTAQQLLLRLCSDLESAKIKYNRLHGVAKTMPEQQVLVDGFKHCFPKLSLSLQEVSRGAMQAFRQHKETKRAVAAKASAGAAAGSSASLGSRGHLPQLQQQSSAGLHGSSSHDSHGGVASGGPFLTVSPSGGTYSLAAQDQGRSPSALSRDDAVSVSGHTTSSQQQNQTEDPLLCFYRELRDTALVSDDPGTLWIRSFYDHLEWTTAVVEAVLDIAPAVASAPFTEATVRVLESVVACAAAFSVVEPEGLEEQGVSCVFDDDTVLAGAGLLGSSTAQSYMFTGQGLGGGGAYTTDYSSMPGSSNKATDRGSTVAGVMSAAPGGVATHPLLAARAMNSTNGSGRDRRDMKGGFVDASESRVKVRLNLEHPKVKELLEMLNGYLPKPQQDVAILGNTSAAQPPAAIAAAATATASGRLTSPPLNPRDRPGPLALAKSNSLSSKAQSGGVLLSPQQTAQAALRPATAMKRSGVEREKGDTRGLFAGDRDGPGDRGQHLFQQEVPQDPHQQLMLGPLDLSAEDNGNGGDDDESDSAMPSLALVSPEGQASMLFVGTQRTLTPPPAAAAATSSTLTNTNISFAATVTNQLSGDTRNDVSSNGAETAEAKTSQTLLSFLSTLRRHAQSAVERREKKRYDFAFGLARDQALMRGRIPPLTVPQPAPLAPESELFKAIHRRCRNFRITAKRYEIELARLTARTFAVLTELQPRRIAGVAAAQLVVERKAAHLLAMNDFFTVMAAESRTGTAESRRANTPASVHDDQTMKTSGRPGSHTCTDGSTDVVVAPSMLDVRVLREILAGFHTGSSSSDFPTEQTAGGQGAQQAAMAAERQQRAQRAREQVLAAMYVLARTSAVATELSRALLESLPLHIERDVTLARYVAVLESQQTPVATGHDVPHQGHGQRRVGSSGGAVSRAAAFPGWHDGRSVSGGSAAGTAEGDRSSSRTTKKALGNLVPSVLLDLDAGQVLAAATALISPHPHDSEQPHDSKHDGEDVASEGVSKGDDASPVPKIVTASAASPGVGGLVAASSDDEVDDELTLGFGPGQRRPWDTPPDRSLSPSHGSDEKTNDKKRRTKNNDDDTSDDDDDDQSSNVSDDSDGSSSVASLESLDWEAFGIDPRNVPSFDDVSLHDGVNDDDDEHSVSPPLPFQESAAYGNRGTGAADGHAVVTMSPPRRGTAQRSATSTTRPTKTDEGPRRSTLSSLLSKSFSIGAFLTGRDQPTTDGKSEEELLFERKAAAFKRKLRRRERLRSKRETADREMLTKLMSLPFAAARGQSLLDSVKTVHREELKNANANDVDTTVLSNAPVRSLDGGSYNNPAHLRLDAHRLQGGEEAVAKAQASAALLFPNERMEARLTRLLLQEKLRRADFDGDDVSAGDLTAQPSLSSGGVMANPIAMNAAGSRPLSRGNSLLSPDMLAGRGGGSDRRSPSALELPSSAASAAGSDFSAAALLNNLGGISGEFSATAGGGGIELMQFETVADVLLAVDDDLQRREGKSLGMVDSGAGRGGGGGGGDGSTHGAAGSSVLQGYVALAQSRLKPSTRQTAAAGFANQDHTNLDGGVSGTVEDDSVEQRIEAIVLARLLAIARGAGDPALLDVLAPSVYLPALHQQFSSDATAAFVAASTAVTAVFRALVAEREAAFIARVKARDAKVRRDDLLRGILQDDTNTSPDPSTMLLSNNNNSSLGGFSSKFGLGPVIRVGRDEDFNSPDLERDVQRRLLAAQKKKADEEKTVALSGNATGSAATPASAPQERGGNSALKLSSVRTPSRPLFPGSVGGLVIDDSDDDDDTSSSGDGIPHGRPLPPSTSTPIPGEDHPTTATSAPSSTAARHVTAANESMDALRALQRAQATRAAKQPTMSTVLKAPSLSRASRVLSLLRRVNARSGIVDHSHGQDAAGSRSAPIQVATSKMLSRVGSNLESDVSPSSFTSVSPLSTAKGSPKGVPPGAASYSPPSALVHAQKNSAGGANGAVPVPRGMSFYALPSSAGPALLSTEGDHHTAGIDATVVGSQDQIPDAIRRALYSLQDGSMRAKVETLRTNGVSVMCSRQWVQPAQPTTVALPLGYEEEPEFPPEDYLTSPTSQATDRKLGTSTPTTTAATSNRNRDAVSSIGQQVGSSTSHDNAGSSMAPSGAVADGGAKQKRPTVKHVVIDVAPSQLTRYLLKLSKDLTRFELWKPSNTTQPDATWPLSCVKSIEEDRGAFCSITGMSQQPSTLSGTLAGVGSASSAQGRHVGLPLTPQALIAQEEEERQRQAQNQSASVAPKSRQTSAGRPIRVALFPQRDNARTETSGRRSPPPVLPSGGSPASTAPTTRRGSPVKPGRVRLNARFMLVEDGDDDGEVMSPRQETHHGSSGSQQHTVSQIDLRGPTASRLLDHQNRASGTAPSGAGDLSAPLLSGTPEVGTSHPNPVLGEAVSRHAVYSAVAGNAAAARSAADLSGTGDAMRRDVRAVASSSAFLVRGALDRSGPLPAGPPTSGAGGVHVSEVNGGTLGQQRQHRPSHDEGVAADETSIVMVLPTTLAYEPWVDLLREVTVLHPLLPLLLDTEDSAQGADTGGLRDGNHSSRQRRASDQTSSHDQHRRGSVESERLSGFGVREKPSHRIGHSLTPPVRNLDVLRHTVMDDAAVTTVTPTSAPASAAAPHVPATSATTAAAATAASLAAHPSQRSSSRGGLGDLDARPVMTPHRPRSGSTMSDRGSKDRSRHRSGGESTGAGRELRGQHLVVHPTTGSQLRTSGPKDPVYLSAGMRQGSTDTEATVDTASSAAVTPVATPATAGYPQDLRQSHHRDPQLLARQTELHRPLHQRNDPAAAAPASPAALSPATPPPVPRGRAPLMSPAAQQPTAALPGATPTPSRRPRFDPKQAMDLI